MTHAHAASLVLFLVLLSLAAGCAQPTSRSQQQIPTQLGISKHRVNLSIETYGYYESGQFYDECSGIYIKPWFEGDARFLNATHFTLDYTDIVFSENNVSSMPLAVAVWSAKERTIDIQQKDGTKAWTTVYDKDQLLFSANDTLSVNKTISIPFSSMYLEFPPSDMVISKMYPEKRIEIHRRGHYIVNITMFPPHSEKIEAENDGFCMCTDYRSTP